MDAILIEVYRTMLRDRQCSADDILCKPELRQEFLRNSRRSLGDERDEAELLRRLANLRKRSKLPRRNGPKISRN